MRRHTSHNNRQLDSPIYQGIKKLSFEKKYLIAALFILYLRSWFSREKFLSLLRYIDESDATLVVDIYENLSNTPHDKLIQVVQDAIQYINSFERPHQEGQNVMEESNPQQTSSISGGRMERTIRNNEYSEQESKEQKNNDQENEHKEKSEDEHEDKHKNKNEDEHKNKNEDEHKNKNEDEYKDKIEDEYNDEYKGEYENERKDEIEDEYEDEYEDERESNSIYLPQYEKRMEENLHSEWKWMALLYLINFSILEEKHYDSRLRTNLFHIANMLGINSEKLTENEFRLAYQLWRAVQNSRSGLFSRFRRNGEIKNIEQLKNRSSTSGRWWKLGGLSIIGGSVVAIAGGLAAPVLIPSLLGVLGLVAAGGTLLGLGAVVVTLTAAASGIITFGGIPLIVGIFGLAGGGLTAYYADKRFCGVSHFKFTKIMSPDQALFLYRYAKIFEEEEEELSHHLSHSSSNSLNLSSIAHMESSKRKLSEIPPPYQNPREKTRFVEKMKSDHLGMNVVISIAGCLNYRAACAKRGRREFSEKWLSVCINSPFSEHYVLEWEPHILSSLGHTIRDFVLSAIGKELFKLWLSAISVTISAAFTAVTAPLFGLGIFRFVNNPWRLAMDKAIKSGKILGQVLMDRVHGNRPVTLIGVGLGARIIFEALKILADNGKTGIVENVFFIGGAISENITTWTKVRSVVSGRVVNAYCQKDWILGVLYRTLEFSTSVAGVFPVKHADIENVCLDHICNGYSSYENPLRMKRVLEYLQIHSSIRVFDDSSPSPVQLQDIEVYHEFSEKDQEEIMASVKEFYNNTKDSTDEEKLEILSKGAMNLEHQLHSNMINESGMNEAERRLQMNQGSQDYQMGGMNQGIGGVNQSIGGGMNQSIGGGMNQGSQYNASLMYQMRGMNQSIGGGMNQSIGRGTTQNSITGAPYPQPPQYSPSTLQSIQSMPSTTSISTTSSTPYDYSDLYIDE